MTKAIAASLFVYEVSSVPNTLVVEASYSEDWEVQARFNVIASLSGIAQTRAAYKAAAIAAILDYATIQGWTIVEADMSFQFVIYPFSVRSFANPSRTLNSAFQISTTKDALVQYSVDIALSLSLLAGQKGKVTLQYADDSGFTTNVVSVAEVENGASGILGLSNNSAQVLAGVIPAAKYAKLVTANVVGSPTITFRRSQEVLL